MLILGSYNSWSAMHACSGTARVLKAGLNQARTLAQARNRYVGFEFSSYTSNTVQHISGYQMYICTNETGEIEQLLNSLNSSGSVAAQESVLNQMGISIISPYQRFSNHIRLVSSTSPLNVNNPEDGAILFFRPDGSVWSGYPAHSHYAGVYTRHKFNGVPMTRFLRIDLATGSIETIKGEQP